MPRAHETHQKEIRQETKCSWRNPEFALIEERFGWLDACVEIRRRQQPRPPHHLSAIRRQAHNTDAALYRSDEELLLCTLQPTAGEQIDGQNICRFKRLLATLVAALLEVLEEDVEGLGLLSVVGHLNKTFDAKANQFGRDGLEQCMCVVTIIAKIITYPPSRQIEPPALFGSHQ